MKTRCCSVSISKTAALLPNAANSLLKDHFFGHMLCHLPDKLTSRSLQIMLVKTAQAEDENLIKWTMDNKTLELTKSGVRHILCVGNPNGTILDLMPSGVTKSTRGGRGGRGRGRGRGRGGRGSKPTHEEGSSKATRGVSKPPRGGSKPTQGVSKTSAGGSKHTKLPEAFNEMFDLLKIAVDNNWDLKEEEVD